MLVFKKGVFGIVHDGSNGEIVTVYTTPLTEREKSLILEVLDFRKRELLTSQEDINGYFDIIDQEEWEKDFKNQFKNVFEFIN